MKDLTLLKSIFSDDPETLRILDAREQSRTMEDIRGLLLESLKQKVTQIEFLKGADGHTPTDEELLALIEPLIPVKGVHYFDGENPDPEVVKAEIMASLKIPTAKEIVRKVLPLIPPPIPVDQEAIVKEVVAQIPPPKPGKDAVVDQDAIVEAIIERLKTKKELDISHIKNSNQFLFGGKKYKTEELMHGGGSSTGGSTLATETPVGAVNDVNVTFTVSNTPLYIVVNGAQYTVGTGLYTSYVAGTITLSSAVGSGGFITSFYQT